MMKMRKIASLLLIAVSLTTTMTFAGCKKEKTEESKPQTVMFADFEQWAPDFQLMRVMSNFGAVSVNEDTEFVHGGKASAKLQPLGGYRVSQAPFKYKQSDPPYVYFPLSSVNFEYDHSNVAKIEKIRLHLYNAQSEQKTVKIGFVAQIVNIEETVRTAGTEFALKPGWNEINYFPDYALLNVLCDMHDVPGLYLEFEKTASRDIADAPVFYLDDIELTLRKTPAEAAEAEFAPGEICDFEKRYQEFIIAVEAIKEETRGDVKVVRAADEGLVAPSGERVLKLVTKPGSVDYATWPTFAIPENIVRKSGFMNIPKDEWADYVFRFEVYMKDTTDYFYAEYFVAGNNNRHAISVNARIPGKKPQTGKWLTYEQPFTEFASAIIENPGYMRIAWAEYSAQEERTYYFDNFRFEKKTVQE